MPSAKKPVSVFVISDATGITAERVISAVLVQFTREIAPLIQRFPFVRSVKQLSRILSQAQRDNSVVIYSLVSKRLRRWMARQRGQYQVEIIDILGPLLKRMERLLGLIPQLRPGMLGVIGEHSMHLAASIDFTLRHDDGHGQSTLGKADIIIVGVSRTSKTPTSLYLSCNHNLKVANVPIVLGVEPPAKIFNLKRPRKVGFTIEAGKLAAIRQSRYQGRRIDGYNDLITIRRELAYCQEVFDRIEGISVVDVTNSSIEEVANQIA